MSGLSGGFLMYNMSSSMLVAWFTFTLSKRKFGSQSLRYKPDISLGDSDLFETLKKLYPPIAVLMIS